MTDSEKFGFKITFIGDGGVGKTSLIKKYTKGIFEKEYIKTLGAQFSNYDKILNNDKIRLIFWDIAGQDDFRFLHPLFYKGSRAGIIVYSLEENKLGEDSFTHVEDWHNKLREFCGDIPVVLFANKVDLIKNSNRDNIELQEFVKKYNFLDYYITSAKTGEGVIAAFNAVIETLYYKTKNILSSE
jgi:small GTP-binding protein